MEERKYKIKKKKNKTKNIINDDLNLRSSEENESDDKFDNKPDDESDNKSNDKSDNESSNEKKKTYLGLINQQKLF